MHVVVLGNGITGLTAARRLRQKRPDWQITMVSGESTHPYARPALMYVYMGHMRYADTKPYADDYWPKHRIDLLRAWIRKIDVAAKRLHVNGGGEIAYDKLLVATGSKSNRFGWPGQDLPGVQGLYGLQDLTLLHENAKRCEHAVIVGGGLIGIELAEMLHSRGIAVTLLVREASYWNNVIPKEESEMINRIIREQGVGLVLETNLEAILAGDDGRVRAVLTEHGEEIACQLVGLTPGVSPNVDVAKLSGGVDTNRGVLVDRSFRTSAEDVFAAGDCAEIVTGAERNLIQQVWYTGEMQGRVAGDVIAGEAREYVPGVWYNSAKFFDLEYQVYGRVNEHVPGEESLYWEHRGGKRSVRVVHADDAVIGFNVMGIRWRHEVADRWIRERRSVRYVLDHLREAHFDPELCERHEAEITASLGGQLGREAQPA